MRIQQDFKELLALLNSHKVEYLVVGAYALAHHGAPRFTGDLDLGENSSSRIREPQVAGKIWPTPKRSEKSS
jgi:hypothetical protein